MVNVAGNTDIDGETDWGIGDWLVSNGVAWGKVDNTQAVVSVAGKIGIVTLDKTDVSLDNVDDTADTAKPVSTPQQTALNLKQDRSATDGKLYGLKDGTLEEIVGLQVTRRRHVATAGQTLFTVVYEVGADIDVFWNGVLMDEDTDFTALTGTDITLSVSAQLDDIIKIRVY